MADNKKAVEIKVSPSKYHTPEERHEAHVNFRISDRLLRMVEEALIDARKITPLKTQTDFYRWAVQWGLKELLSDLKNNKLTELFHQFEAHQQILKDQYMREKHLEILESTRKEVHNLEALGAYSEVPRFLRKVEASINLDGPSYWTIRVREEFYREFGERLKADRISARPRDAEKDEE